VSFRNVERTCGKVAIETGQFKTAELFNERKAAMMTPEERKIALQKMQDINDWFYNQAVHVNNNPYIEFCGLMNEYVKACRVAHEQGVDFSECNKHSGQVLPLTPYMSDYINEKLECIFFRC
jgi:Fe-S cluster biosynthesis and repair protein YggX